MYWTLKPRSHRRTCRSSPSGRSTRRSAPVRTSPDRRNTLLYERDGFEVAIESYKTTHWRVDLDPESIGKWYPRPLDPRLSVPEYGFVDSVETSDSYAAIGATLIIQENFQPTFEVRKVIEHLLDNAEKSEQFTEELDGKLDAARENERELKEENAE